MQFRLASNSQFSCLNLSTGMKGVYYHIQPHLFKNQKQVLLPVACGRALELGSDPGETLSKPSSVLICSICTGPDGAAHRLSHCKVN